MTRAGGGTEGGTKPPRARTTLGAHADVVSTSRASNFVLRTLFKTFARLKANHRQSGEDMHL